MSIFKRDTGPAKTPGLQRPNVEDSSLRRWVDAVTEWIELRSGARGNENERAVTVRELEEVKAMNKPAAQSVPTSGQTSVSVNSVGVGVPVLDSVQGSTINFRTLSAGAGVTLTNVAGGAITISATQNNQTSVDGGNVGTGAGKVFKEKYGSTLNFKSIKAGSNITITDEADDVTISASIGGSGNLMPAADNAFDIGSSTLRWQDIWGVVGIYGDVGYVELPSSIGSGANSGIPNRGSSSLVTQKGTTAAPATGGTERAFSSQAVVSAPYPYNSPSHWSPNEFSVINQGVGRVNALNSVLVTSTDLQMDNTAIYSYAKNNYAGGKTGLGGVVGLWSIVDTRGSPTRGVGAEFVLMHDFADRYDYNPKSLLSENANDTTNGAFHAGVRISTLLSSKIVARALDIITGSPNAGFDTGINIQAFRSRALYIHNNLDPGVGGNRVGIEFADTVDNTMLWTTKDGNQYIFKQDYSMSKGYYYNFRKDADNNWLGMYSDGTVTLSGSNSTGTKLTVRPDGTIIAGHTTATNAGFAVPAGGFFWLNHQKTSYITQSGSNIILVKNGVTVAVW